jgi:vacuolar-type H+-ATPase subunit I/STV1
MWKEIKKLLVDLLWPQIKDVIKKLMREFSGWMFTKVKEMIQRRKTESANKAEAKAYEASEKSRTAETDDEARQHEAIAKVWREVAEMFRQENEALQVELELLQRNSDSKAEHAVARLAFDQAIDESGEEFKVKEGGQLLQLDERNPK